MRLPRFRGEAWVGNARGARLADAPVPIGRVIVSRRSCICVRIHQEGAYGYCPAKDGVYELIDRCQPAVVYRGVTIPSVQLRKRLSTRARRNRCDSVKRSRPALSVFQR